MIVIYTNWLIPARFSGYTIGPVILIRPEKRGDRGLLEHEKVHVRQFLDPRRWFDGKLIWEVEAYREQMKWYSDDRSRSFARLLSTRYGFNISEEEALSLLKES